MRTNFRPIRLAVASIGACMVIVSPSWAGDIFCGHKSHDSGSKLRSGVGSVPVGTPVYLPLSSSAPSSTLATVGLATLTAPESNPLAACHAAEVAKYRYERATALAKAELETTNRILQRIGTSDCTTCQNKDSNTDLSKKLDELNNRLGNMENRLTAVEKVLLTHDAFLKDMVEKKAIPQPKP